MFSKKNNGNELDTKKLNEIIFISKKILSITYILLIVVGLYAITILLKELNVMPFLKTVLKIVSPLFIGIVIAWLFDPFVRYLNKKGVKRTLGAALTYVILIGGILIIVGSLIPLLSDQVNDFAKTIPAVFDSIKIWIDNVFDKLANIENFNSNSMKTEVFNKIEIYGENLTESLPEITVTFIKSFFSVMGTLVIGLIIGFYLLVSFDSASEIITFIPKKFQSDSKKLIDDINNSLRKFVRGALIDSSIVFVITSLGLWAVGLKAPALFGLFCGLTNIIPYAGPYIGGAPAVIVAFSQSPTTGILVLTIIVLVQFIEGNFLQPLIMSKTTKLHPVTIMLGLLVFGYFWGIIGMIVSTPIIAVLKAIFVFFDEKYDILDFNN